MSYKDCIFLAHKQTGEFILFSVHNKNTLEDQTEKFAKDYFFKTETERANTYAKARIEDYCNIRV